MRWVYKLYNWLYNFLFLLLLPFIFLRLWSRARQNPDYARRWKERLGWVSPSMPEGVVWWHCVSVGETLAAIKMIGLFQQKYLNLPILVTTMTPTGSVQVQKHLGNRVFHQYIPYDIYFIIKPFIAHIKPRLCILMETELWPNMISICHQKNIAVLLANARMSEKSAQKYKRFSGFTRHILSCMTLIAAQSESDADQFRRLGYPPERIVITGSVKFDLDISEELIQKAREMRAKWGIERPVWIASSTHAGEEEILLQAAKEIQKNLHNFNKSVLKKTLLILVPRYPHRREDILNLCQKSGLKTCLRSKGEYPDDNTDVFLIDTLGELMLFYAVSDAAFVGGSLIDRGGHNLLEPAALGLPVLSGESVYNFAHIAKLLSDAGGLITVKNAQALSQQVTDLLSHPERRKTISQHAKTVVMQNKGAVEKHILLIDRLLQKY